MTERERHRVIHRTPRRRLRDRHARGHARLGGRTGTSREYKEAVRSVGGGNVGFLNLADESGQIPRSIEERLQAASADCNVRVPVPEYKSSVFGDAAYRRMIELLECIAAQGFETPDPPSLEAWLESGANAASAWNPYTEMFAGSTVSDTTQEERRRLMETCPQSLPSYYVEAPDPRD